MNDDRDAHRPDEKDAGTDENRALTQWTTKDELEREDERVGGDETPKLSNPPG